MDPQYIPLVQSILTGVITGAITITTCLISVAASYKKRDIEQDQRMAALESKVTLEIQKVSDTITKCNEITQLKIVELDAKQEKHNKVIERVYKTEKDIEVLTEKVKVANNRIQDLERKES